MTTSAWGANQSLIRLVLVCCAALIACQTSSNFANADLSKSILQATPARVPATGKDFALITAYVRRGDATAVAGMHVQLVMANCVIMQPTAVTDANGMAAGQVACTATGPRTVSATVSDGEFTAALPATATVTFVPPSSNTLQAGTAADLEVVAHGATGSIDAGYTGTVRFVSSDPNATLPTSLTFTTSDAGSTLIPAGVVLRTAGVQTVSAVDATTGALIDTETFTVQAGPAASFALSNLTAPLQAGGVSSFGLQALDAYGNAVTDYAGTVHVSSTDSLATLPADTTLSGGSGRFTGLVLRHAGSTVLQFADVSEGSISGATTVQVVAGGPVNLQVSLGAPVMYVGLPATITVSVVDAYANIVPSYTGLIRFSTSDVAATPPADAVVMAAHHGVLTLPAAVTFLTPGPQSLSAIDESMALAGTAMGVVRTASAPATLQVSGPTTVTAGTAGIFLVTAYDAYGDVAVGYTGTVHFASSDLLGTLPADTTFAPSDQGTKTFPSVVLRAVGPAWLSASDASNADVTGMSQLTVTPSGTYFSSAFPSANGPAGATQTLIVTARHATGSIDTGFTGIVRFLSDDPQASLPPDTPFGGGTLTLPNSVTWRTAGVRQLVVTSNSNTTTGAATFLVTAGSPAQLLVTLPPTAPAGNGVSVNVRAVDAHGNLVTPYRGTIAFASTDREASLPSTYTFTAQDNGSHTFTTTLTTAGSQTVTATDTQAPGLTGTSNTTRVVPGTTVTLQLSSSTTVVAGAPQTATVRALDAYGNVAPDYAAMVHFDTSDPGATVPADYTFTASDAGVAVFDAGFIFATAGAQSVTLSDVTSASVLPAALQVSVQPGPAASLALALSSSAFAGQALSPQVTAYDAYGNVVPGYQGTIQWQSSDTQAILPAPYTYVAGDAGTHSFIGALVFQTTGSSSVTVTDSAARLLTTQAMSIVPPMNAASLQVSGLTNATAGAAQSVTVAALDSNGNVIPTYSGRVHFTSSDPQATVPADYTFAAADNGTKTFTGVVLATSGSQGVTVTDIVNGASGTQSGVAISASDATTLTVSGITSGVAGSSNSVTVSALDAYGNVATSYRGTVETTSTDAQAVLPATYTFTSSDAGTHTFSSIVLKTVGAQSVTATDAGQSSITGAQSGITVTAATASHLAVSGITGGTAGVATTMLVTALDSYGNTAVGYRGTVHFTSSDAQAVLPASYVFAASDNGVRSFPASVTLKTAGAQSVMATDASNITGTQSGIVVIAAAAANLQVAGLTAGPAGAAQTVTVTAQDSYGNLATSYTGTIHFGSTDLQAALPADATFISSNAGSRTFGVVLKTAGTQSVTATDTVQGSITGSQNSISISSADATTLTLSGLSGVTAGTTQTATLTAQDGYGNVAAGYTGTVHFTSSDPQAIEPADYTFTAGNAGQYTFVNGFVLKTAGTQSINATDSTTNSIAGSATGLVITPAAATSLVVAGLVDSTAGTLQSMTVTAKDAYNNIATGYLSRVHFTSSDPDAALPADYAFASSDNGQKSFTGVAIKAAGTQSVTTTDVVTSSITGTQAGLTITAATATALQVSGISSGPAGSASAAQVKAVDAYDNTAISYTGTVHFTSSDGQAVLPSNYTFTAGDVGVHTFSGGITLKTVGTQSVTATDSAASSITGTQNDISITANSAAILQLSGLVSSPAGTAQTITAVLKDSYGNAATAYTGTLHFTSSDTQASVPGDYTFVGADAGTHTFVGGVALKTAGAQTLTVVDTVTSTLTSTVGATVQAATPIQLAVAYPSTVTAGNSNTLTVAAKDAYGNVTPSYTGTVEITSSDGRATLPSAYTYQGSNNGAYAFTVQLISAGTQSLTATDANGAVSPSTQGNIVVQAAAVTGLALTGVPATQVAGQTSSVTVNAQDTYGNVATTYNGTVHFHSSDGQASLPPDTALINGTKTFSNAVTLKTAGVQTVTVTDTVQSTLTTNQNDTVTAGALSAALSSITASPTSLPADHNTTTLLTVSAKDSYGNPIPSQSVVLNANGLGDTFSSASGSTNASGVFTATLMSTSRGGQTVTANMSGTNKTATVTFTPATSCLAPQMVFTAGTSPYGLVTADFNGDGVTDVAVGDGGHDTINVLFGQGGGVFGTPASYAVGSAPWGVAAADINADGKPDLAAANSGAATASVLLNQGAGHFGSQISYDVDVYAADVKLVDVNGDNKPDLITADDDGNDVSVLLNQGNGTFASQATYVTDVFPEALAVADVNGDGKPDIAVTANESNHVDIFINSGAGVFARGVYYPTGAAPYGISAVDLNGDNKPDLAIANNGDNTLSVLLNQGGGTFGTATPYAAGTAPIGLAAADISGDGIADIVTANTGSNNISYLLNQGAGTFAAQKNYTTNSEPVWVVLTDVNADGKNDVVVSTASGSVSVLLNTCY